MNPYKWLKKEARADQLFSRAGQLFGITLICLMYYAIASKGYHDISYIIQNSPGDFWRSFASYILTNLAVQ